MADRVIPQRELRNKIGEVLRQAQAGSEFTITVRGRPVARLGPANRSTVRAVDVNGATVNALLAQTPVDERFAADLADIRAAESPADEPWPGH